MADARRSPITVQVHIRRASLSPELRKLFSRSGDCTTMRSIKRQSTSRTTCACGLLHDCRSRLPRRRTLLAAMTSSSSRTLIHLLYSALCRGGPLMDFLRIPIRVCTRHLALVNMAVGCSLGLSRMLQLGKAGKARDAVFVLPRRHRLFVHTLPRALDIEPMAKTGWVVSA